MTEFEPPEFPLVAPTLRSTRPPGAPAGPVGMLADRVCLQISAARIGNLPKMIDEALSGLVISGSPSYPASGAIRKLRRVGHAGILVADPNECSRYLATVNEPFRVEKEGLVKVQTLVGYLDHQIASGATVALTPTGYIPTGHADIYRAVVAAVDEIRDRKDTMLALPLEAGWFKNANIDQTIGIAIEARMPLALMLGGQFNPVERAPEIIPNLRRFYRAVPHVALFRTDFAGFDALAHGALTTAIGVSTTYRHTTPPGDPAQHGGGSDDHSPSVLFPELGVWFKGSKIDAWFPGRTAPTCHCTACKGARRLNSFLDGDDEEDAQAHAIAVWTEWAAILITTTHPAARAKSWQNFCKGRVGEHAIYREQRGMQDNKKLHPQEWLKRCAELPVDSLPPQA